MDPITASITYALSLVGFGPLGPVAGSIAAGVQSAFYAGAVPAGGVFATLQGIGMGNPIGAAVSAAGGAAIASLGGVAVCASSSNGTAT